MQKIEFTRLNEKITRGDCDDCIHWIVCERRRNVMDADMLWNMEYPYTIMFSCSNFRGRN